jgi:hypothetical protein
MGHGTRRVALANTAACAWARQAVVRMRQRRQLSSGLLTAPARSLLLPVVLLALLLPAASAVAAVPVVESVGFSGVTPFEARLEGVVDPDGERTECSFEYGEGSVSENSVECEPGVLEGSGGQGVGRTVTGLSSGVTYRYRLLARNGSGEQESAGEFSTLVAEAPTVEGEGISGLSSTGVRIEAQVNPNYQETTSVVEYATNEALAGATTVAGPSLPAGFGAQPVVVALTGLEPRTVYYYRVTATNDTGATHGPTVPTEEFETFGTPVVSAGEVEGATQGTAALSGVIDPGGVPTSYHFAFVEQAGYEPSAADPYASGRVTTESPLATSSGTVLTDYAPHTAEAFIEELKPATTYHLALVATNSQGTVVGPDVSFTTAPPTPPVASTGGASGVSASAATIAGSVDTGGLATVSRFEYGTTPGLGSTLPATLTGSEGDIAAITTTFTTLQPGTTYYYRASATNPDGSSSGVLESFTTAAIPGATTPPPVAMIAWPAFVNSGLAKLGRETPPSTAHSTPPLTKKQKLAKALKQCKKDKQKSKRANCEKHAKKTYGNSKKAKKSARGPRS